MMPLVFMGSIREFAEPVEEHGPGRGVLRLSLLSPTSMRHRNSRC